MDTYARDRHGRLPFSGTLAWTLLALAACTSGDGGGTPGGSQGPDPVVLDFAIAFVKRPVPEMGMQSDARQLLEFNEGGDLFVRDRASPSSAEINVTGEITGDRKSTRLNSSHSQISYAVFCLKKKI